MSNTTTEMPAQSEITYDSSKPLPPEIIGKLRYTRSFEIVVEEKDEREDGTEFWKPVMLDTRLGGNGRIVIKVNSPRELKELQNQYAAAGQRFKIVNEVGKLTNEQMYALAVEQNLISANSISRQPASTASSPVVSDIQSAVPVAAPANANISSPEQTPFTRSLEPMKAASAPKYYKIGDIEIKDDNGKIYQKQWLALTDAESANLRVINSKNNQIVNMNGKRFEMKKWVLVEMSADASMSLEENLR